MLLMRKVAFIYGICFVLILSGCLPTGQNQPEEQQDNQDLPPVIAPTIDVEENYYGGLSPYKPSQAKGMLYGNLNNYRLDTERIELGLLEMAQDYFPTDEYLFEDGQTITQNDLQRWLRVNSEENQQGLNPKEEPDRVLLHIVEHNYIDMQGQDLEGMVLALSLISTYTEPDTGERRYYTDDNLRIMGQDMANQLTEYLRQRIDVPIIIALYRLEQEGEMVPGNFLSIGNVQRERTEVTDWVTIDETYLLFPSTNLRDHNRELWNNFNRLRDNTQEFFPHHIGMIGVGRFVDEQLVELTINVTSEVSSKSEVIQLTQYLGGEITRLLPENIHLNVYMKTMDQPQSVLVRPIGREPLMHIYR